jgi:hypothetical protein
MSLRLESAASAIQEAGLFAHASTRLRSLLRIISKEAAIGRSKTLIDIPKERFRTEQKPFWQFSATCTVNGIVLVPR